MRKKIRQPSIVPQWVNLQNFVNRRNKRKKLLAFLNRKIKIKRQPFLELQMHRIHHMQYFKLKFLNHFDKVKDFKNLHCVPKVSKLAFVAILDEKTETKIFDFCTLVINIYHPVLRFVKETNAFKLFDRLLFFSSFT